MLSTNEEYICETIELIKLSGHVVAGKLVFEPWSETTVNVLSDFAVRGITFDDKMSDEDERILIENAYIDPHIWPIAKKYTIAMFKKGAAMTSDALNFYGYVASNGEPNWPGGKRRNFYRDDLIATLIQYLITQYDLRISLTFGLHRNAPSIIREAFLRLSYEDAPSVRVISNLWQRSITRSKYSKTYFLHRAARLALKLEESGWRYAQVQQLAVHAGDISQSDENALRS